MEATVERIIPLREGIAALQQSVLENTGGLVVPYYQRAVIRVADLRPDECNPVSLYLLQKNLDKQRELRAFLWDRYAIDTLQMSVIVHLRTPEGLVGVCPPYVEVSHETVQLIPSDAELETPAYQSMRVPLIVDGLHRAWLAREEGVPLRCVIAEGGDPAYPYGAYPVGWHEVKVYDAVPPVKKRYRRADKYSFMRDLDALRMLPKAQEAKEYGR